MNGLAWLLPAVLGGVLVGASAGALALLLGRGAGTGGIVAGLMQPVRGERGWRWAFVAGLLAAPVAHVLVAPVPTAHLSHSVPLLAVAGLLVGVGAGLGGCTTGRGVCGPAYLSRRSLMAMLVMAGSSMATVFVARHVLGG